MFGIKELKSSIKQSVVVTKQINNNDCSIAIFGKPNAGKSTFLNTLLGYKRSLTSPTAGTTSDYVVDTFRFKKKLFNGL